MINFAIVYEEKGDTALAGLYYEKANKLSDSMRWYSTLNYIKKNFLLKNNQITEGRKIALQLLQLGQQLSNNDMKLTGAVHLRSIYERQQQLDSAYYYSRMESTINALIYSQNNIKGISKNSIFCY